MKEDYLKDERFAGIEPFEKRLNLSTPTMHGDDERWVVEAIRTNWVSTVGENINVVEAEIAKLTGRGYAVGLSSGTAALHLAVRILAQELYGIPKTGHGSLEG
ncbi:MAG: DegT/DnrJ/EryC1/StrS family aminotransferase, partial [Clostridia bacterium]|nr:DegT/DnrJ/EryC1/StrS family aminotransferase [Clostridia bacterium]